MNKNSILLILFMLIFGIIGCQPTADSVVNPQTEKTGIVSISAPVEFNFSKEDSTYLIRVLVNKPTVAEIYADLYNPSNIRLTPDGFKLYDNGAVAVSDLRAGDSVYSNLFLMQQKFAKGVYRIEYTLRLPSGEISKAGFSSFLYDNKQSNIPPQLLGSNVPDTVSVDVPFVFSATVLDSNGLGDVKEVVFRLYRPDGSVVSNPAGGNNWQMYDDGNLSAHGDAVAGDGVYSFANYFTASSARGQWKFEFQAKDRSAFFSQVITETFILK